MSLRRTLGLCVLLWLAGFVAGGCDPRRVSSPGAMWKAGTSDHEVRVQSDDRGYVLHVPAAPRRNRLAIAVAYPLIVVLHGSGADGETVERQSGMDHLADSLHFVVAYPNGATRIFGLGSDWNAGKCCGNPARANVDDVGFIRAVVADVSKNLPIDRRRVYVAGFSDGGRMAYRIGCDASDLVGAIGVVSGSLVDDSCAPARPVPLIAFHGTSDSEVSYGEEAEGVQPKAMIASSASLPPSVRYWATTDKCQRVAIARPAAHIARAQFTGCAADVLFFAVDSGGHAWPGGAKDGDDGAVPTHELNASQAMVGFFMRHPLR